MADEEIEKEAKEYAQGNFYSEQGFIYGYERGFTEGRKEAVDKQFKEAYKRYVNNSLATFDMKKELQNARDTIKIIKENEQLKRDLYNTEANLQSMTINCENLEKDNKELKQQNKIILEDNDNLNIWIDELKAQIEKMKNVGNCKHFMECTEINEKEFILGKIVTCKSCKKWETAE